MSVADREYMALVRKFPLRPIRSEKELDRAIAVIDSLIGKDTLSQAEEDYLDVLSDLVERYETEEHPMPPVSDSAILRHLIEARDVSQTEVARTTGIAVSTVSAVLGGKRTLSRSHFGRLAKYFRVPPSVFLFED